MNKIIVSFLAVMICLNAKADDFDMNVALRNTYENCFGIDAALHDMKVKAGITTVVTGVGTGLGIGATVVGIAKAQTDKTLEQRFKMIEDLSYGAGDKQTVEGNEFYQHFVQCLKDDTDDVYQNNNLSKQESQQVRELTEKSKRLGNWRTGLLVGNTATNIAGAVLSGTNKVDQTLQEQIQGCISSVKILHKAIMQAKLNKEDVSEAQKIESACKEFAYVDITKIDNMAKGGMVSSIVGTGTGTVGIITSALANSDNIRNDDSEQGKRKERNLNTTANVFAAGSTVASATATIFNASQIKAIKDVANVATKCTEALK